MSRGGCDKLVYDWQRYTARSSTTIKSECSTNAPATGEDNSVSMFTQRFARFYCMYVLAGDFSNVIFELTSY